MKQISLVLNIILLAAVAFLMYHHFNQEPADVSIAEETMQSNIVFVNSDSLLDKYEYFQDLEKLFEEKRDAIKRTVEQRERNFEREVEQYQQSAPTMSPQDRATKEQSLYLKGETLQKQKQDMVDRFAKEEGLYNDSLFIRLHAFINNYNKGKSYDYILGYQRGGGILFAKDTLDITNELVNALNAEYKNEKE